MKRLPEIPPAIWVYNTGFNREGDRIDYAALIDHTGRCVASVERPYQGEMFYECWKRSGWAKGFGEGEVYFIDLEPAKRYCERYAAAILEKEKRSRQPKRKGSRKKKARVLEPPKSEGGKE